MPSPRYHTIIFVETDSETGTGVKYHVTGDITSGMSFDIHRDHKPESFKEFFGKELLGYVSDAHHPKQFQELLASIPAPAKQKAFNMKTLKTEPVKTWSPLTFYEPGEPRRPLIKCTE